jgi:hypothetical protein
MFIAFIICLDLTIKLFETKIVSISKAHTQDIFSDNHDIFLALHITQNAYYLLIVFKKFDKLYWFVT